jgi:UDP-galactose transporter B1
MAKEVEMLVGVSGIYVFYLLYGIVQERVTTTPFGPNGERFDFMFFLVCLQCILNALFALIVLGFNRLWTKQAPKDKVPFTEYAWISLTYVLAMLCSNSSLQFVDYPTQVLGKSCKPIPVMLMGALVYGRSYNWRKWMCVLLITAGIALFMFKSKGGAVADDVTPWGVMWGYALLLASLAFDGLTGPAQERLYEKYNPKPTFVHVMFYSNVWAVLYMGAGVLVTGETVPATLFTIRHPEIVWYIFLFGVCSGLGQFFIYYTLQHFGSLVLTVATTTRKFFTILASVLWFGHALSLTKWFAVGLVFAGLSIEILGKYVDDYLARAPAPAPASAKPKPKPSADSSKKAKTVKKAKKVQ